MRLDRNRVLTSAMFCGLGGFFLFMLWPDQKGIVLGAVLVAVGVWVAVMPQKLLNRQIQAQSRQVEAEQRYLAENPNNLTVLAPWLKWGFFGIAVLWMGFSWRFLPSLEEPWMLGIGVVMVVIGVLVDFTAKMRVMVGARKYRSSDSEPL